jgi:hypothetical protein
MRIDRLLVAAMKTHLAGLKTACRWFRNAELKTWYLSKMLLQTLLNRAVARFELFPNSHILG